jgi:hypothetical protein
MIDYKNIKNFEECKNMDLAFFEQDIKFYIGNLKASYEMTIERDSEGNIDEFKRYGVLNHATWDEEDSVAYSFSTMPYIWAELDQILFDADEYETVTYWVDFIKFIQNDYFNDEEIEFLKENSKGVYMPVYITIQENRVYFEDEY